MFRKQRALKKLSADELKTKLYSHFDKTGSLNRIRTELRGKLVSELLKVAAPLEASQTDEVYLEFDKTLLPLQVTNWLVYDHLLRQGHQYALSIFVTEANLAQPEKLLTACDILSLFGLDSTTPEYKSISNMYSTNTVHGCSYSLLLAVIKTLFDLSHHDEKLANKELENTVPKDLLHKLLDSETLFCKNETSMEEPLALKNKPDFNELQMSIEENRRENSGLRQRLLEEIDRLHAQERSQQVGVEQERLLLKKERDSLLKERESLKEKELVLIKEYENKLERKIGELKMDFATKIQSKDKTLEDLKLKLFEKEQRLEQIEIEYSSQQTSFIILKKELDDIQKIHKLTQEKYLTLLNDNTNLQKKFENMSDYTMVKDELQIKSQQMSNLHKEIEDISKTSQKEREALMEIVRNMEAKLSAKNSELSEAQRQLNVTRDTLHMKETAWNRDKRRLEQENLASKELYRSFSQKLEDQKGDIQALHQTLHLLYYQIADKDNRKMTEPIFYKKLARTAVDRTTNEPDVFRINRNFNESPPKCKDSSLKYIENAKNIKFKLQQQEDELQDKYSFSNDHIFNSVPQSNSRLFTSHLAFNSSRAHSNALLTDPVNRFSSRSKDNFRNLIGNEMPSLDLSFPAHIKNSLERTFSDNTAVKSPDNFTSNNPKSLPLSSSNNMDILIDRLEPDSEGLHSQIQKFKGPQSLDSAVYSNIKDGSQNLTFKDSNQTVLNALEKVTPGISSLEKEFTVPEKSFPSVETEIPKYDFQERKLLSLSLEQNILPSTSQEPRSSSALETTENLKPGVLKQTAQDISTKGSENLPYDNPKEVVTEAPKDTDSKTVSNYTSQAESVKDVPIVVDLDAAWKRKLSLQHESPVKMYTLEQDTTKNTLLLDSSLIKTTSLKSSSEGTTQIKTYAQSVEDTNKSVLQTESLKQAESNSQNSHQDISEMVGQGLTECVHKDSSQPTDEDSVKDAASESKRDEDSLSEMHFSCGSEQEQQKEDSDNW